MLCKSVLDLSLMNIDVYLYLGTNIPTVLVTAELQGPLYLWPNRNQTGI